MQQPPLMESKSKRNNYVLIHLENKQKIKFCKIKSFFEVDYYWIKLQQTCKCQILYFH